MKALFIVAFLLGCEIAISDPPHHPQREEAKLCLEQMDRMDAMTVQCAQILNQETDSAKDDDHD